MMVKLHDVVEANRILVSLGGEDQMQRIAAASIERSLELQNRIDRALAYAASTPANSSHARQIARILDGSITVDDELNEMQERDLPMPESRYYLEEAAARHAPLPAAPAPRPKPRPAAEAVDKRGRRIGNRKSGLAGRTKNERKAFREWAVANGYDVGMTGPVSNAVVAAYDEAMAEERKARAAARRETQQLPGLG